MMSELTELCPSYGIVLKIGSNFMAVCLIFYVVFVLKIELCSPVTATIGWLSGWLPVKSMQSPFRYCRAIIIPWCSLIAVF